jgi:hypothetical protein
VHKTDDCYSLLAGAMSYGSSRKFCLQRAMIITGNILGLRIASDAFSFPELKKSYNK